MRRLGEKINAQRVAAEWTQKHYRCPRCAVYFCYKCRARVGKRDAQFECANQSCACYGKLICSACTVMVPQQKEVPYQRTEFPERRIKTWNWSKLALAIMFAGFLAATAFWDWRPLFVVYLVIVGVIIFWHSASLNGDSIIGLRFFQRETVIPAKLKSVVYNYDIDHRSCVECRQPAKSLVA